MKFISLRDTHHQIVITVDATQYTVSIEENGVIKKTRVKPFVAAILYALFHAHPQPVGYEVLEKIFHRYYVMVPDVTRMHRKISDIRHCLESIHPCLKDVIHNTRNLGYSLPLWFTAIGSQSEGVVLSFSNPQVEQAVATLETLVHQSIEVTSQASVIRQSWGWVIDRDPFISFLSHAIPLFTQCQDTIFKELRLHNEDFLALRIQYLLAKLKTYIGLARISQYPISETQWYDWFEIEVDKLFQDVRKVIKLAEN